MLFPRELLNFADDAPADVLALEALRHDDVDLTVRMQAEDVYKRQAFVSSTGAG